MFAFLRRQPGARVGLPVTGLALAACLLAACGPKQAAVCPDKPQHYVLIPSTSSSDLETSRALAHDVAGQVVARGADSCGRITVGLQTPRVESDLELRSKSLTPARSTAFNRKPVIRPLIKRGTKFVDSALLQPLAKIAPSSGSPFLGALAKVSAELRAHGTGPATVILLGDGIDIERSPSGARVDFRRSSVSHEPLDEFVPLLSGLKGSCVLLVGEGAASRLPGQTLRNARRLLGDTLRKAGVGFAATRSRDLPPGCDR